MKAPDKIFLPGDIDWPSAAILTLGNQPGDVEYIRKDVLLEWLEKKVGISYGVATEAFVEVIDKLNEMTPTDEIQEQREALLDQVQDVYEAALDLVNAVEKYVRQETSRSTLIGKKNKLKKLIEG